MPASYPRLPVELLRRIFDEVTRGEDAAEPEDLGRVVARVCRDWKDVGQELAFRRPVLWGYYRSKAVPALAEAKDCSIESLHELPQICPGVTHVNWGFDKPDLLQAMFPHFPSTNLTSLSISWLPQH
ncbi:F-box domain-containing protein [Rhodotorula toruloides]|nr:F-box domain-containing protein [Rhodotorula toruloides]